MNRQRELFEAACSLPPERWQAFLAAQCPDDPQQAAEVLRLLQVDREHGRDSYVPWSQAQHVPTELLHPAEIGPYTIVRLIGEGGMGSVYEAVEAEHVERRVAIKLVKLGMDSREIVGRFERERQTLAMMQHDGIAKVHASGTTPRGQPYFVMEFVTGKPITEFCRHHGLSVERRLRLVRQLCAAVQHAHQKGLVHRDLKPDNVLVQLQDGKPHVKVIDFGLAKSIRGALPRGDFRTRAGEWGGGTPLYMAPEQTGVDDDIDTRADIYSIGVILYELLTGSLPLTADVLLRDGEPGIFQALREAEPPRPSQRLRNDTALLESMAKACGSTESALLRALRADLDWPTMRALEKDRERRYESAAALSADLLRYLDGEALLAGPPTTRYRLARFVRRRKKQFAAVGALALVLLVAVVMVTSSAIESGRTVTAFRQLAGVLEFQELERDKDALDRASPWDLAPRTRWLETARALVKRRQEFVDGLRRLTADAAATDASQGFLRTQLEALLANLDRLQPPDDDATAPATEPAQVAYIPAVEQQRTWAEQTGAGLMRSHGGGVPWEQVWQSFAASDSPYAKAPPARDEHCWLGLVPIGPNPTTKLWEFYDLRSAWNGVTPAADIAVPKHEPDGRIQITPGTGIVFVLVPGGGIELQEEGDKRPCNVSLPPFLIARHELTRAQWQRLGGDRESCWHADGSGEPTSECLPAEFMDWQTAHDLLRRHGMQLPSEAQWEYACRAGSRGPYGCREADLPKYAHLWQDAEDRTRREPLPVGSLQPNAYGLHDMHGNVEEWCQDWATYYDERDVEVRKVDGLRMLTESPRNTDLRIYRGGSFAAQPAQATSGWRGRRSPTDRDKHLGMRPVRLLPPAPHTGQGAKAQNAAVSADGRAR